jgi:hypothetical protein
LGNLDCHCRFVGGTCHTAPERWALPLVPRFGGWARGLLPSRPPHYLLFDEFLGRVTSFCHIYCPLGFSKIIKQSMIGVSGKGGLSSVVCCKCFGTSAARCTVRQIVSVGDTWVTLVSTGMILSIITMIEYGPYQNGTPKRTQPPCTTRG